VVPEQRPLMAEPAGHDDLHGWQTRLEVEVGAAI